MLPTATGEESSVTLPKGDETAKWRRFVPSAIIHFLAVECLHIYLATLSWWSLVVDVNVKVAFMQNKVSISPFHRYYSDLYFKGVAQGVRVTFNEGLPVELPSATVMTHQTDVPWLLLDWAFLLAAVVLFVYSVGSFAKEGPFWSFEDGRYIHFTWRLPRSRVYQASVWVMTLTAVLLPLLWVVQVFMYTDGEMMSNNLEVFFHSWKSGLLLLMALSRLGSFKIGLCSIARAPAYWHVRRSADPVQDVSLVRRPEQMLSGSNASLESKLLDALWAAENGDISRLERCLLDEGRAHSFLQACKAAQVSYNATTSADT